MTKKNHDDAHGDDEVLPGSGNGPTGEEGSEAQVSDPHSQGEEPELTVDDILNTEQDAAAGAADGGEAPASDHEAALLHDLKRVTAEYANYRRRTQEQRQLEIERAQARVAEGLLPVLDDLDLADQHGDLVEGSAFAVIADKIRTAVAKLGVEAYGAVGDVFDPQQHEAIFQQPTPGATETTVLDVVQVGYRLGDVELRPAKVVVAVPAE